MNYAVRRHHQSVVVQSFPIANRRIQRAMSSLRTALNTEQSGLTQHLASVSFSSSWEDAEDSDCVVTLNYEQAIQDKEAWREAARVVCAKLRLAQMTGRSKGCVLQALENVDAIVRDTLWLSPSDKGDRLEWTVYVSFTESILSPIPVQYEKPEGAFFHPNARAMLHALEWMLQRVSLVARRQRSSSGPRLLELYCGFGAHTVALARSSLLQSIVAVELDGRLVKACKRNCELNNIAVSSGQNRNPENAVTTATVDIVLDDAGGWARDYLGSSCGGKETQGPRHRESFDILLVDPPRQGLHEQVCRMAISGSFQHVLYVSCGHEALTRDLAILCEGFEVVDCALLDLFPGTDAVESLVHLQRHTSNG
jgi:23S rRNA (uracil1939-C5)-methyltransferase